MMSRTYRVAALLAALILLTGCASQPDDQQIEFRVPVFVKEVGTGSVEDRVIATGSLRAPEAIALTPENAGILIVARNDRGRRLAEGDHVTVGQTIAEITGEDIRLAAGTEASWQRYETARRDHESKLSASQDGLISDMELRQAESTLADAKMELERSRHTENRSKLTTPISGVILHLARDDQGLPIADGQQVAAGVSVAQIAPIGNLVADVDIVGADVARVRRGLVARIRHHAWEDEPFEGRVVRLAPTLDPATRTLRTEVSVNNDKGLLRPGMFVEVTMITERREDVPVVPREAVTERGGRKVVFVLKGQKVERREVAVGLGDDEIVEIRQGLEAGERIVVRGLETLTDGTRVRVSGS
jgi:membrane fusion protein (multidrug efflux system)